VLCATGTTWAHTTLSGHAVDALGLLVLAVVAAASVGACLLLARRRLGVLPLLAVCAAGQGLAHAAMALTMPAGHAMPGMASQSSLTDGGVGMLLAHVAVAVVTAALARGGESALLDLARQLVTRLLPLLPGVVALPTPQDRPATYVAVARRGRRVSARVGSRGPPVAAHARPC